ncbi:hypothetical protein Hamer_G007175 [Homarus americanus]|uniref:Uncharacterized protein n=1 Tax=Homarus americanus TaxID=6706 RepID=A0A8J5K2H1_HOMAM|nr:hypothetical protein Hamer_G007175 [Homarus americanus]
MAHSRAIVEVEAKRFRYPPHQHNAKASPQTRRGDGHQPWVDQQWWPFHCFN